jgi:hypothetical protein
LAVYFCSWLTKATWGDAQTRPEFVKDEQTGHLFKVKPETGFAVIVAAISATYLIAALLFLLWLLFDTWSGRDVLLVRMGYDKAVLAAGSFRLLAYVAIGGGIGGAVDGLRAIIFWHAEKKGYGPRFIWRDLALPPMGAAVGLIAYAIVRGGVGLLSGDVSLDPKSGTPVMAAFAVGTLAGFSALQAFRWFDWQANKIFGTTTASQISVPELTGLSVDEAATVLKAQNLTLGAQAHVQGVPEDQSAAKDYVVSWQSPESGKQVDVQSAVNVTLGPKMKPANPKP